MAPFGPSRPRPHRGRCTSQEAPARRGSLSPDAARLPHGRLSVARAGRRPVPARMARADGTEQLRDAGVQAPDGAVGGDGHHPGQRRAGRSRRSHHPVHRGRRNRPRHLAGLRPRLRCSRPQGLRRCQACRLVRGPGRREGQRADGGVAAGRYAGGRARVPGRNQGAAHDTGGRRHPQPERVDPAVARSVRVRPARSLLPRDAVAGAQPGADGCRDLPREHRGRLLGDRVGAGLGRGAPPHRIPRVADGQARARGFGSRHQADLDHRHEAPGAHGHPPCARQRPDERDPRAQGQHHEVHGGRVPRLGVRGGAGGVRRAHRQGVGRGAERPASS